MCCSAVALPITHHFVVGEYEKKVLIENCGKINAYSLYAPEPAKNPNGNDLCLEGPAPKMQLHRET